MSESKMPEQIWIAEGYGWVMAAPAVEAASTKYVRADIHAAALAEASKKVEQAAKLAYEGRMEAFAGNVEAVSKLGLDVMDIQPLLMSVQDWSISTGRARELIRCWILGTFDASRLPAPTGLELSEDEMPWEVLERTRAELTEAKAEIERLKTERDEARSVLRSLDHFQRQYDINTMQVNQMPGNDLYSGMLMDIVYAARKVLTDQDVAAILAKSDEEIMADALEELGSEEAVEAEVEKIRGIFDAAAAKVGIKFPEAP